MKDKMKMTGRPMRVSVDTFISSFILHPSSFTPRRRRPREGMVLVIVLWIIVGLVAVLLLFADTMRMEYRASGNRVAGIEAGQAAEGARRYLTYVLGALTTPGTIPETGSYKAEAVPLGESQFWVIGRSDEELESQDTPFFGFVDEASKLNLNTATVEMLETLPNMTLELAAAIIDWRDADSDPQPNGAESDAYTFGDSAYPCKNAPFETVEELRLVKGATWDLLYGEDENRNGVLDPNEDDGEASFPDDDSDGKLRKGILDYVTVYSKEPNRRPDGSSRIDVRRPRNPELRPFLEETLGDARAGEIVAAVGGAGPGFRSVLEFYFAGAVTPEEATKLDPALTANNGDYVTGRVNVNSAPREVLTCVPGIGERYADQLTALRRTKTADQLGSPMWITEVVDRPSAVLAGPNITAHSYQLSADVVAVAPGGRALRRLWMSFDTGGAEPVVLYCADRTSLGWPLGSTLRDTFDGRQPAPRRLL